MSLSLDQMKAITRRFTIEPWSLGNLAVLDEVCAPNYTLGDSMNLQALKDAITAYREAVPDLKVDIGEMVAEGDLVAYRWTMHGTHLGELYGTPPTGKQVKSTGITIVRFAGGKIVHDQFESSGPNFEQQASP